MNEITQIRPISDQDAAGFMSVEALADLADLITSMPIREDSRRTRQHGRAGTRTTRSHRTHLRSLAVVALVAAAVMVGVMTLGGTGSSVGPVNLGPASAQALSFTKHGRYIIVIVRDPFADPARYRAEFAAHNLNVKLQMVPASPSLVGQVVYFGGTHLTQIKPITRDPSARCDSPGGGCTIGVKISTNYHGTADIAFGRAARPGEQYESSGSVTAPGEAMHGLKYQGKTVTALLALLKTRDVTVPQYRWTDNGYSRSLRPGHVPGNWIVQNAIPWASHQVLLFVKPKASSSSLQPALTRTTS
jgi:hypothetical protein